MTQPANVIILDEPTNDLDSETLELLEDQLVTFAGTLLMVSHDRTFLNNVVTSTIVFEDGEVNEYVGGYDEWRAAVDRRRQAGAAKSPHREKKALSKPTQVVAQKLSYNDQRELKQLPNIIEKLESEINELHEQMSDPDFYQSGGEQIAAKSAKLGELEKSLTAAYARWESLEA